MLDNGSLVTDPDFDEAGGAFVLLGDLDDSDDSDDEWYARAATLEGYVVERLADGNPIPPDATGKTDDNGMLIFNDLPRGLYLMIGSQTVIDNTVYTPLAALISLPNFDDNGNGDYSPTAYVKNEPMPLSDDDEYINLTAVKVWKDEGYENERPNNVTVTLYRNDEEYETVTLSAENNWKHTWTVLEDASRWILVEKNVPAEYTVTSVQEGKAFVVTNTYKETTPPDNPPPETNPPETNPPEETDVPSGSGLPQTGQLWWPVSLLAMCGLVIFMVGFGIRRKGGGRHE
jgi:hypothetical protein